MPSDGRNRRRAERKRCVVQGRVYVDGHPAVQCAIGDVTPEGAKLTAQGGLPTRVLTAKGYLPDAEKLLVYIPAIRQVWAAVVRWRDGTSFGIEFVRGEADLPSGEEFAEPDSFAMQLQVAQAKDTSQRLVEDDADAEARRASRRRA